MRKASTSQRWIALLALFLVLSALIGTLALASQQNGAGGVLRSISTEADSGVAAFQNTASATVSLAGTDQAGLDTVNTVGAHLYAGLLDPLTPIEPPNPSPHIPELLIY